MPLSVGDPAPDFTLYNIDRETVSLDDLRGGNALVVFIPFPFTGTCEGEVCTIRDRMSDLDDLDATVVVITTTPLPSNKAWADQNGIEYPVLSDFWPHGEVTRAYEAFDDRVGAANRRTFVLDAEGVIRAIVETDTRAVAREFDEYLAALEAIGS
jgi:peroxiredoxin